MTNKYNLCLNRTFMELKPFCYRKSTQERTRLNRTFMELKHRNEMSKIIERTGLNRTFMELKLLLHELPCKLHDVLIVPLWN